ncbi:MAG: hypothetical protein K1X28_08460 [Parachlamydiales bacterium]|nr:hypothetical protein [Parachlamydiales bacterium]
MTVAVQNTNYSENKTFLGRFVDYTGSAVGAMRECSMIRGVCRLYNAVVANPSPVASTVEGVAGTTVTGLGIVRLPSATRAAIEDVAKAGDDTPGWRKIGVAFRSVMDAVFAWTSVGAFVTSNPTLRNVATVADFSQDSADLAIAVADHNQLTRYEKAASGDVKEAFAHSRKYNMLRVAKAVLSVAAGVFAMWMLMTGVTILPLVLTILLSLATTMVAIRRDLYKDEGKFKLIDLHHSYSFNEFENIS